MKRNHMDFFLISKKEASKSHHDRFFHGSVTVHRNTVIGKGCNRNRIHAEVSSIKNIHNYFKYDNLVVYVCRINRRGGFMMSKPCSNCMAFMKKQGVSKVYYSDEDGFSKLIL